MMEEEGLVSLGQIVITRIEEIWQWREKDS